MKNYNKIIESHVKAIDVAEQRLQLIKTMDEVFAWTIFTEGNKENFFKPIITYLGQIASVKIVPVEARNKAKKLLAEFKSEYSKSN